MPWDISSAAFFIVGAMISPAGALLIRGVGVNTTRTGIIDVLRKMGGAVEAQNERVASGEPVADLLVKTSRLKGAEVSGAELLPAIDEFPIICVAAAFAEGTTRITGAKELRVKESDRIAAMSEALSRVGVRNAELPDGIVIEGVGSSSIKGGRIESHGDHRIAMSMAMAALRSDEGVEIDGASSVDVSFPGFFDQLKKVRVS